MAEDVGPRLGTELRLTSRDWLELGCGNRVNSGLATLSGFTNLSPSMFSLCRLSAGLLLASVCAVEQRAAEFKIPPISGEFAGKFRATGLAGSPEVAWKLRIQPESSGRKQVEADLTSEGARLRLRADLDSATGNGTWEVLESELDAGAWLAVLSPQLGEFLANVTASGKLQLTGSGEIKDGRPSGVAKLRWENGSLINAVDDWKLEGISLNGDLAVDFLDIAAMTSSSPWELAIQTISSTRFGARNLFVSAAFNEDRTVSVLSARVELAGGEVTVDPATISLFPPVFNFNVRIHRVGLQDLVALVPASLSDARGRIDGVVRLGWSERVGLQVGVGNFKLRDDEIAILRLVSAPGFLTEQVPERISLLPAWMGAIGRWFSPKNPVYDDIEEIELGRTELQIVSFDVALNPEGDERNRTGVVQVSARATAPGAVVKLVSFEVNIFGSVSQLLRYSMIDQASFRVR